MTLAFPKPVKDLKARHKGRKGQTPMQRHEMRTKGRKKGIKSVKGALHMHDVKGLSCVACGRDGPSDCHHVFHDRYSGKKASDWATIPLCKVCHQVGQGSIHADKNQWRENFGPDWSYIPQTLQAIYGDKFSDDH
jgi:hypothetical protein